jgi:hypothetical protein
MTAHFLGQHVLFSWKVAGWLERCYRIGENGCIPEMKNTEPRGVQYLEPIMQEPSPPRPMEIMDILLVCAHFRCICNIHS